MGNVTRFRRSGLGYVSFAVALLAGGTLLHQYGYLPARLGGAERAPRTALANVSAIDGDSLRAGRDQFRLVGIDAPEMRQTCRDENNHAWACGREAHAHLRALVARGAVACASHSRDRYGRALAHCSAGDVADIGEEMVRTGFAVNFMSGNYHAAEAEARREKRGIWRGGFERPADYRARHARTAAR
jgi:endonuclease YncB( thermonuclease family)